MIQSVVIFFGLILISTSCSSGQTRPPSAQLIKEYRHKLKNDPTFIREVELNRLAENERQVLLYLQAKEFEKDNKNKQACSRYKYLSKDKSFPLNELAAIESIKVCEFFKISSIILWNQTLADVSPSNRKLYLENSIILAKKKKLNEYYIRFSLEYTDFIETKNKKEKHLVSLYKEFKSQKQFRELIEDKLIQISPRFTKKPKSDQYLSVAKDFARNRQFTKARQYYKKVFTDKKQNTSQRIDAYYRFVFSYKLQRQKKEFSWKLEQMLKWYEKNFFPSQNNFIVRKYWEYKIESSRAQWTVNFRTRAEKQLAQIIKDSPSNLNFRAHAYLLLGKIEVEKKNYTNAQKFYELGLTQISISDEHLEDLAWSLGWNKYLEKDYKKALSTFTQASSKTEDQTFKQKLMFWRAKTLIQLERNDDAKDLYEQVIESDPYGYYGAASAIEMNTKLSKITTSKQEITKSPYPVLDWLVRLDLYDQAEDFIKEKEKSIDEDNVEEFLPLYGYTKWYAGGIFRFFKVDENKRDDILNDHIYTAYPFPYHEEANLASAKTNVPTAFLYAIARQESAFNHKARSWADAFGLLQLTPEKAKSLSKKYKIKYTDFSDLYDVKINLTLGALLLKELASNTKGNFFSIVASYNAGRKPVTGWYQSRYREDVFEFFEMVPYEETRKYLKLVLRNYAIYTRLSGNAFKMTKEELSKKFY